MLKIYLLMEQSNSFTVGNNAVTNACNNTQMI